MILNKRVILNQEALLPIVKKCYQDFGLIDVKGIVIERREYGHLLNEYVVEFDNGFKIPFTQSLLTVIEEEYEY